MKRDVIHNYFKTEQQKLAEELPVVSVKAGQVIDIEGNGQYQILFRNGKPVLVSVTCD